MTNILKKITAPNGGVFTGKGTNTYLIGNDEITLVDPGPNIPEHIKNIIETTCRILRLVNILTRK